MSCTDEIAYGKSAAQRAEIGRYFETIQPRLRAAASIELDGRRSPSDLADLLEALAPITR
jgi:hypothetical protein